MKTILVDDMLLDLQLFELKCADLPDFEIVGRFTEIGRASCRERVFGLV